MVQRTFSYIISALGGQIFKSNHGNEKEQGTVEEQELDINQQFFPPKDIKDLDCGENQSTPEEDLLENYRIDIIIGEPQVKLFQQYGLVDFGWMETDIPRDIFSVYLPSKEDFISGLKEKVTPGSYHIIENLDQIVDLWWKSQSKKFKRTFSVLPVYSQFWEKLNSDCKLLIYNYTILRENNLPVKEYYLGSLLSGICSDLSDMALEYIYQIPLENMYDQENRLVDKYQDKFNQLYEDIEDIIRNYFHSDMKKEISLK